MSDDAPRRPDRPLRRGWTTGACATAAAKAAFQALLTGEFPDPVDDPPAARRDAVFALARTQIGDGWARASVIKDAGDDPDVTHQRGDRRDGAAAAPRHGHSLQGRAGVGTGRPWPGLADPAGRAGDQSGAAQDDAEAIEEVAEAHGASSPTSRSRSPFPAAKPRAKRPGTRGSASSAGFRSWARPASSCPISCSAWIHSIHSGIDVARAAGLEHVAGSTGNTSEAAVRELYALPDIALLDMGDFAGGLLKYLRDHPIPNLTIAGGFAQAREARAGRARPAFIARRRWTVISSRVLAARAGARRGAAAASPKRTPRRKRSKLAGSGLPLAALVAARAETSRSRAGAKRLVAVEHSRRRPRWRVLAETGHG